MSDMYISNRMVRENEDLAHLKDDEMQFIGSPKGFLASVFAKHDASKSESANVQAEVAAGLRELGYAPAPTAAPIRQTWEDWYQNEYLAGKVCHCCGQDAETEPSKWGPLCARCWSCPVNGCDVDGADDDEVDVDA